MTQEQALKQTAPGPGQQVAEWGICFLLLPPSRDRAGKQPSAWHLPLRTLQATLWAECTQAQQQGLGLLGDDGSGLPNSRCPEGRPLQASRGNRMPQGCQVPRALAPSWQLCLTRSLAFHSLGQGE